MKSTYIVVAIIIVALVGCGFWAAMPLLQKEKAKTQVAETKATVATVQNKAGAATQQLDRQTTVKINKSENKSQSDVADIRAVKPKVVYVKVPGKDRVLERTYDDRAFFRSVCSTSVYARAQDRYRDRC